MVAAVLGALTVWNQNGCEARKMRIRNLIFVGVLIGGLMLNLVLLGAYVVFGILMSCCLLAECRNDEKDSPS